METITAFRTQDGTLFESEILAMKHEVANRHDSSLKDFFNGHCSYSAMASCAVIRKGIIEWELFKEKIPLGISTHTSKPRMLATLQSLTRRIAIETSLASLKTCLK